MAKAKQIDTIYKKYASRVVSSVASTEFYDYFMSIIKSGTNTFQFSNRKVEKNVDETWVMAIEAVIKPLDEIIANPRNFIIQEEIIVNVALAKKVTPDSIRHLAQHGHMIDNVEEDNVRPNRLMDKLKEDTWDTYENKFAYTLLEMAWEFVDKRYEAIFAALGEEYGATLKMNSKMHSYNESITANIDLKILQEEDLLSTDKKNETIFSRIARLHRVLGNFRHSHFAIEMSKIGKIKPPLVRTNAIAKNPNFKACHKLWNFIMAYKDIGYNIKIIDQNPNIDEDFTMDIYNSILFNYIILKNYLESPEDRKIDIQNKIKKKQLKPKFIKEIIEEMVKNYDLPDVEIRKVLIDEITKEQLMQEEEKERLRLVEEKEKEMEAKRIAEEKEKARLEKEKEKERIKKEKEELKERIRQEKLREAELLRLKKEQEKKEEEDVQRGVLLQMELEEAKANRQRILEKIAKEKNRRELEEKKREIERAEQKAKEVEAAKKIEEEKAKQAEKEKLAKEKAKQAEKEKLAKEKAKQVEKEKIAKEKTKQAEKEKLAKEKTKQAEKEKLAKEKAKQAEKEKLAKEKAKQVEKEKPSVVKEEIIKVIETVGKEVEIEPIQTQQIETNQAENPQTETHQETKIEVPIEELSNIEKPIEKVEKKSEPQWERYNTLPNKELIDDIKVSPKKEKHKEIHHNEKSKEIEAPKPIEEKPQSFTEKLKKWWGK